MIALIVACTQPVSTPEDSSAPPAHDSVEHLPTVTDTAPEAPTKDELYDPLTIHDLDLTLSQASLNALTLDPDTYVEADLHHRGQTYERIGVRLKGNSSFRRLPEKPALKVKLHAFVPDQRLGEVERLTLNNNVHDPSMMAETLAYRTYRAAGSPAPRTGYARVTLNGVRLGLYTLVEAMDDEFVEDAWPDSLGTLYEPARGCDLDEDISCYTVDQPGDDHDPEELQVVHDAAVSGDFDTVWAHVDAERVLAYFAAERFTAHEDSYSYNDNNHHLFFEPDGALVSLSPWGADSTFVYIYPGDVLDYACVSRQETLDRGPSGFLALACEADTDCADQLREALLDFTAQVEASDLVAFVGEVADTIRDDVYAEPRTPYEPAHFDQRVACHIEWIENRPDAVRAFVGR